MTKIAIAVRPGKGHMYPTLPLAKAVVRQGGTVVYVGDGAAADLAASEGFQYLKIDLRPQAEIVGQCFHRHHYLAAQRALHNLLNVGRDFLIRESIDAVFIDPTYQPYVLCAVDCAVRIYYLSPFNFPLLGDPVAPINTRWQPTRRFGESIRIWALWRYAWLREQRKRFTSVWAVRDTLVSPIFGYGRVMREVSRRRSIRIRFGLFGYLLEFPHVILGPRELDFPWRSPHSIYLGACVDRTRKEPPLGSLPETPGPLVYCSFGTNVGQYQDVTRIWEAVVTLFRRRTDWRLVLHAPKFQPSGEVPPNISIREEVPTLQMLRHARCAVIHGGYGTLKECVLAEVPMLVVPFKWDQPGNSARVRHHGLGEALVGRNVTPETLEPAIIRLLENPSYRRRLSEMRARIDSDDALNEFAAALALGTESPVLLPA